MHNCAGDIAGIETSVHIIIIADEAWCSRNGLVGCSSSGDVGIIYTVDFRMAVHKERE